MELRKTEIAMGDCITSDLERVGEEGTGDSDRKRSKRKKIKMRGRIDTMEKEIMVNSTPSTVLPRK